MKPLLESYTITNGHESALVLEKLMKELVPDGWRCAVYFRKWIQDDRDKGTAMGAVPPSCSI